MAKPTNTQRKILENALTEIREDVTTEDRNEAVKQLGINKGTVSRYLNGDVRNNDTGTKLLVLLRGRIDARMKQIVNS